MQLPIPRGRISHSLFEDVGWLFRSTFQKIDDLRKITRFQSVFAGYVGRKHCLVFPFARTGIYSVLKNLDLPENSVVIMPPITIKPILDVVLDLKLIPVFVDIDPSTVCFSEVGLSEALKSKPRVAILTYLFGIVPNVEKICDSLKSAEVFVIEDFSQCLNGSFRRKKIGTFGDVSVYSASSVKTLDTYGGGFVFTDDHEMARKLSDDQRKLSKPSRLRLLKKIQTDLVRNLASQPIVFAILTFPILRLIDKRGGTNLTKFTGDRDKKPISSLPSEWFESYSSIQAKVGLQQLRQMEEKDAKRLRAVNTLNKAHTFMDRPVGVEGGENVYWQYIIYANEFKKLQKHLISRGIDCATTSLVKISGLESYRFHGHTPNADRLYSNGIYLPCYHQLTDSQISRIAKALSEIESS
jgi:dTDP-4-amino-4,6-dideoxygalactose transaminase